MRYLSERAALPPGDCRESDTSSTDESRCVAVHAGLSRARDTRCQAEAARSPASGPRSDEIVGASGLLIARACKAHVIVHDHFVIAQQRTHENRALWLENSNTMLEYGEGRRGFKPHASPDRSMTLT